MTANARDPSLIVIKHLDTRSLRSLAAVAAKSAVRSAGHAQGIGASALAHAARVDANSLVPKKPSAATRASRSRPRGAGMLALGLFIGLCVGRMTMASDAGAHAPAVDLTTTTSAAPR